MRRTITLLAALALICSWAGPARSAEPQGTLVEEINTATVPRPINRLQNGAGFAARLGQQVLFMDDDAEHGLELWRTDGTTEGTRLLADLNPGPEGITTDSVVPPVVAGSKLFFLAYGMGAGSALVATDGTTEGTHANLHAGWSLRHLTAVGNRVFYTLSKGSEQELWVSDGIMATRVRPLQISVIGSAALGDRLLLAATTVGAGTNLWVSDGTANGTQQLTDFSPGIEDRAKQWAPFATLGGASFFFADNGTGRALWKTDGSSAGTRKVIAMDGQSLASAGGLLFFQGTSVDGGVEHQWLWKSDGTGSGTVKVQDFGAFDSSTTKLRYLTDIDGMLYFDAGQPWVSDGTTTIQLSATYMDSLSAPLQVRFVKAGSNVFFVGGWYGDAELWATQGTPGTTRKVKDINPVFSSNPYWLTTLGDLVFFYANDSNDIDLWQSDGTEAGTRPARAQTVPDGIDTPTFAYEKEQTVGDEFLAVGGRLFFVADSGGDIELWSSDGTAAGTTRTRDINPGGSSLPYNLVSLGGQAFFIPYDGAQFGLWRSDGTEAGTVLLKAPAYRAVVFKGQLLYTTSDGTDTTIWKSDGTSAGEVVTTLPGITSAGNLTPAGDTLFFIGYSGSTSQVWRSDGTAAGTAKVKDITTTALQNYFVNAVGTPGRMYFVFYFISPFSSSHPYDIWASDGTSDGTLKVATSYTEAAPVLKAVGDKVFFVGAEPQGTPTLWVSDGMLAGTHALASAPVGPYSVTALANLKDSLLFSADDGTHGMELWRTDGTEAGTALVADINPGQGSSGVANIVTIGEYAYFSAADGLSGTALWRTDGTAAGTVKLAEVAPGPASANPRDFTLVGTRLFFLANDGTTGPELHALDLALLRPFQVLLPLISRP